MSILFIAVLLVSVPSILSQSILAKMQLDPRISQFTQILQSNPTYVSYIQANSICILAPSNRAMQGVTFTDDLVRRHIFLSLNKYQPTKGVVAAWSSYEQYKTPSGIDPVYHINSLAGVPLFMSNVTSNFPVVNGARVIQKDLDNAGINNQTYHIINKVLLNGTTLDFLEALNADPSLSQSYSLWNQLKTAINIGKIPAFIPGFLDLSSSLPATMLVPTNDAWSSYSDQASLTNMTTLSAILARHYIAFRIIFTSNTMVPFYAGFKSPPDVDNSQNLPGKMYHDSQGDMVNVQGYVASIVRPNFVMKFGVIHVINSPMTVMETRTTYLQRVAPAFYALVSQNAALSTLLAANNTVLAPDNSTMALINQMDSATQSQALFNCFLLGTVVISSSSNLMVNTAGNVTVRVSITNSSGIVLDTVFSSSERTYTNRARVLVADYSVDGIYVNLISGMIGITVQPCSYMLSTLNRRAYKSLVDSLGITLSLGSPYTIFVPNDASLSSYTNVTSRFRQGQTNVTMTTTTTQTVTLATTPSSGNNTGNGTIPIMVTNPPNNTGGGVPSNAPGTSGSNNPSNSGSNSPSNIQYLLQRMIVANKMVLATRSTGQFKAATMNYAAAKEMLNMEITPASTVNVGIYGTIDSMSSVDGGFYCYSNDPPQQDRYNLLYPVEFLLVTSQDPSLSVCVKTPCAGCLLKGLHSLVLGLGTLVLTWICW